MLQQIIWITIYFGSDTLTKVKKLLTKNADNFCLVLAKNQITLQWICLEVHKILFKSEIQDSPVIYGTTLLILLSP